MLLPDQIFMLKKSKMLLLLSILSFLCETSYSFARDESNPFPWDNIRLPKNVVPIHYDLLIHPNLTTLSFTGLSKIEILITEQTSSIILHSKYLQITKTTIHNTKDSANTAKRMMVLEHPPFEQIALISTEPLQVGQSYIISIEYSAKLSDSFHGFYKSTYRTLAGEIRVLASTQFEATAARMAFPCFDEPALKATFSIKIRRSPKHLALSNMPLVKSVNINEWLIEDQFDISVKMSTYLVAFIISDFESVTKKTLRGIKVSVYAAPHKIKHAEYALDAAVKLLDFYEGYFGIAYPLPKQDLAAIPDFQSGAMENWGLTTYRESALLYDSEKSSVSSKLGITMIVAHELAHQWFGNLVTMEWWNDLWLNEGFAKFMEFVSVSKTHPELKVVSIGFFSSHFNATLGSYPYYVTEGVIHSFHLNLWHIPLTYITNKCNDIQRFLLTSKTNDIVLPEEVEWIKFNVGMNGYYIVHYGDHGWDSLIRLLKDNHEAISSNDRASLINNAFQLVSAGKLSIEKALDLTLYLKHETEITPLYQGLNELIPLYKLLEKTNISDTEQQLKEYIVNVFKNMIDKQSWDDEGTVSEQMLRTSLLTFACVRKYKPCVDKAQEYFMKWKDSFGTLKLPKNIKMAVYAVGIQTDENWDFLFSKYQLPEFDTEKNQIEVVLCLSQNKEKLQWLMDQALQGDIIKTQELPSIIISVGRNPYGYQLAWKFLKENWQKLVKKFDLGSHSLAHIITGLTNQYSTKEQLAEVKSYFSSMDKKTSELRAVHQAIETVEENIQWMDKNLEKIKTWLQINSKV
ncbi:Endoplasmic reticulum aminopeptidase 1, partial [Ophiophagus hannah]